MTNLGFITEFAQHLKQADGLLITAGAGMGVDSGLLDFRGETGFYKAYPPIQHLNKKLVKMSTPSLFETDLKMAWGVYGLRLNNYRDTIPHDGFNLLKKWADKLPQGAFIFTSNVDGQFQKAGFDPDNIVEYHGTIHQLQCLNDCCGETWSADGFTPMVDTETCRLLNYPPVYLDCGAIARPNIFMFNDKNWESEPIELQVEYLNVWLNSVEKLAIIELGAGICISTVRHFGQRLAREYPQSVSFLRINPKEPQVPYLPNCFGVSMGAKEALIALDRIINDIKFRNNK